MFSFLVPDDVEADGRRFRVEAGTAGGGALRCLLCCNAGERLALGPPAREAVARNCAAADRGVRVDRSRHRTAVTWDRDGVVHHGGGWNRQYLRVLLHADRDSEPVGSGSGRRNYQHDGKYFLVPVAILVCISENTERVVFGSLVGGGGGGAHWSDTYIIGPETKRISVQLIR